mmetsp:Transcript_69391/g.193101  ORF Transcript_69391/g.193101 Transcript_69391/m.193101 type:complete len:358 (+) Transcript_69391:54-1127(+)
MLYDVRLRAFLCFAILCGPMLLTILPRGPLLAFDEASHGEWEEAAGSLANTKRGASVAICIVGQTRTLLSCPVRATNNARIVDPLREYGYKVDVFLTLVEDNQHISDLRDKVARFYHPVNFTIHRDSRIHLHCKHIPPFMVQWVSIRKCYELVEIAEERHGKYDWILRTRSDLVWYSSIVPALLNLSQSHVYVPSIGMTDMVNFKCMNDHVFLCPRDLCRPYFHLLELWESPHCQDQQGYPTLLPDGRDPPAEDYNLMPMPANVTEQWYFFARYGGRQFCLPGSSLECCGSVHELLLFYAIARIGGRVECPLRMQIWARPEVRRSDAYKQVFADAFKDCMQFARSGNDCENQSKTMR